MQKFGLIVFRDLTFLILFVQGVILLIGWVIVPAIDTTLWRNLWFPSSWSRYSIDYVSGVVVFFCFGWNNGNYNNDNQMFSKCL